VNKVLAIDSCSNNCSVSLLIDSEVVSRFESGVKSSSYLLPMCESLLKESCLKLTQLEGVVYTKGPGSFTGVRMGVACVQGLALAANLPTLGISSLEVMGYGATKKFKKQKIAIGLDARMGEVYWALYDNKISKELLLKPNDAPELSNDFIGVGSAWLEYEELSKITKIDNFFDYSPNANDLLSLVREKYSDKFSLDLGIIQPTYLRNKVAEVKK